MHYPGLNFTHAHIFLAVFAVKNRHFGESPPFASRLFGGF